MTFVCEAEETCESLRKVENYKNKEILLVDLITSLHR